MKKLILILLFITTTVRSQNDTLYLKPSLGINLGFSYLSSKIDKNYLSNYKINNFFNLYNGSQFHLGLGYEYPISKFIRIGLNLTTSNSIYKINSEAYGNMLNFNQDSIISKYEYELNNTFSKVSLNPFISLQPFKHLFIIFMLKNNFLFDSKSILNKIYNGHDNLVFPENNSQSYNLYSGKINLAKNYNNSFDIALAYEIIIDKINSLSFTPSLNFSFPLNSELNDYQWLTTQIGLNINLKYYISSSKSFNVNYTELFKNDTLIIKKPNAIEQFKTGKTFYTTEIDTIDNFINYTRITSRIDTLILSDENQPDELIIEKPLIINKTSIYNYYPVFTNYFYKFNTNELYQPNNIDIQNKYLQNIFSHSNNSLDTIASRLKNNPSSIILIRSFKDSSELGNCNLTSERSNTLKNLFITKFGIQANQVRIDSNLKDCIIDNINKIKKLNSKSEIITIFNNIISPIKTNEIHYEFKQPFIIKINNDSINIIPIIEKNQIKFLSTNPLININPLPKNLLETSKQIPLEIYYKNYIFPQTINLTIQENKIYRINFLNYENNEIQLNPIKLKQLEIISSQIDNNVSVKIKAFTYKNLTNQTTQKQINYLKLKLRELLPEINFETSEIIPIENNNNPYLLNFTNLIVLEIEVN